MHLQVEGGDFDRFLLLAGEPRQALRERVGNAEFHEVFFILCSATAVDIYANILRDEAYLVKRDWISPVPFYDIIWNPEPGGNVEHIAEHDLTPDDVDAVLLHP